MSQLLFVEDVRSWESTKCQQELDHALPKLVSCFSSDISVDSKVGVLNIICTSFLPHMKLAVIETRLFHNISSKINDLLAEILENAKQIQEVTEKSSECHQDVVAMLKLALNIVESTESCMKYVCGASELVDLENIHSLLSSVLRVLTQSYEHCKESPTIYGDLLPLLSDVLSSFFKKTHQLQTTTLCCLEKINIKSTEQDVVDLCSTCHSLLSLCQLVPALDIKIMIGLWKSLARLAVQYKSFLYSRLELEAVMSSLASSIQSNYDTLLNVAPRIPDKTAEEENPSQTNEKSFQMTLKITGFLMKVLVNFVKEYENYLGKSVEPLYPLILYMFKFSPPSLAAPKLIQQSQQDIQLQLLNAAQPLLTTLILNYYFRILVTSDENDLEPDLALPRILLQIMVVNLLPKAKYDVTEVWYSPRKFPGERCCDNILASVFKTLQKCSVEMASDIRIPITAAVGSPQRNTSLYEYLCTNICGFVGSWPAQHFAVVESVLLTNLLHSNPYCKMMACDVWCFIGRYGSAALCHHHVKVLAAVWLALDWSQSQFYEHVLQLFHRLFKFQLIKDQEEILKLYPPANNLSLWSLAQLDTLQETISSPLKSELVQTSAKIIHSLCSLETFSDKDMKSCLDVLKCLHSLSRYLVTLSQSGCTLHYLVLQRLAMLWSSEPKLSSSASSKCYHSLILSSLLVTSAQLLPVMKPAHISSIVNTLEKLFDLEPDEILRLATSLFLKEIGKVDLQNNEVSVKMGSTFPKIFQHLLFDSNSLLHHQAIEAFASFAQETNCESLVPQCLIMSNSSKEKILQDTAITFLNHTAYSCDGFKQTKYLSSQRLIINEDFVIAWKPERNKKQQPENSPEELLKDQETTDEAQHMSDTESEEPLKKKLKTKTSPDIWDEEYRNIIDLLHGNVNKLQLLQQRRGASPPTW
ncbi:-dependent kinase C-3,Cyclin-dependent kinase 10,Cyclin-dependent kinase 11A,Cyclin-dependent kinase [Octopus vulgaris]|uniref:-dependent kinase C-3,Cyclin-dependent kinase 10,Cyclin-dependent kinase 11A,Cyclin-dependent kinase n=1 Tax=Octopus vulgaris TaxID=6645 RepID=A0AA36BTL2_OCTVU|nr:-dependent kinase C-3,Cyclin-dependent kinase 10,Cyclin-dependent kinase 11A,Cyclin-dependent kinase [Octopus vulgaris]